MLSLVPLPWKIGGLLLLVLMLAGTYAAWAAHERALGAAAVELANAKAVLAQREADAQANAVVVAQLAQKLKDTETKVITVTERIYAAPVTRACGQSPAIRAALDGVQLLYDKPAAVQTGGGAKPAAALPGPRSGAAGPQR